MSDYEKGQRDLLNALLAPNPEIQRKLAAWAEHEPDPHGRIPFDACFWITEVATQLGIKSLEEIEDERTPRQDEEQRSCDTAFQQAQQKSDTNNTVEDPESDSVEFRGLMT